MYFTLMLDLRDTTMLVRENYERLAIFFFIG